MFPILKPLCVALSFVAMNLPAISVSKIYHASFTSFPNQTTRFPRLKTDIIYNISASLGIAIKSHRQRIPPLVETTIGKRGTPRLVLKRRYVSIRWADEYQRPVRQVNMDAARKTWLSSDDGDLRTISKSIFGVRAKIRNDLLKVCGASDAGLVWAAVVDIERPGGGNWVRRGGGGK